MWYIFSQPHKSFTGYLFRFSTWLPKHVVVTFNAILRVLEVCFTPSLHAVKATDVYVVAAWLAPHLNADGVQATPSTS